MVTFSPGLIQTSNLADGSVTTAKLADSAVTNVKVGATAAIALTKLATAPLTEFYVEILLATLSGAANEGAVIRENSSGTANTRTEFDSIFVGTAGTTTEIQGDIERRLIDFARLTGFTITFEAGIRVASGTGTFALRNVTDASDLTTITTTATTLTRVESASITVPTAEKSVSLETQSTGTSVTHTMGFPVLRVKAG